MKWSCNAFYKIIILNKIIIYTLHVVVLQYNMLQKYDVTIIFSVCFIQA